VKFLNIYGHNTRNEVLESKHKHLKLYGQLMQNCKIPGNKLIELFIKHHGLGSNHEHINYLDQNLKNKKL
jgi:hypothetical protein